MVVEVVSLALFGFWFIAWLEKKNESQKDSVKEIVKSKGYVKHYDSKNKIYNIGLNVGSSFSDLEKMKGAFENVLKNEVEVVNENFNYYIKVIEPKIIPTLVPFEIFEVKNKKNLKVAVAKGSDDLIFLDFLKAPHTLIAGATGWGKSVFIKNFIVQLIHNFPSTELELFDFKAGIELADFKDLRQSKSFIIKPHEAEDEINRIYSEIEQRFALITETNSKDWITFNSNNERKLNPKFVIMEEFTILLAQSDELSITLTKALAIARAVGVFFVFTSQRFDAKIIDSRIKANIDNRICFHTADATNSKLILDKTGAEGLKVKGRCLISSAGDIQEGQTFFIQDYDVQNTIKSHLNEPRQAIEKKLINYSSQNKKALNEPIMSESEGVSIWV